MHEVVSNCIEHHRNIIHFEQIYSNEIQINYDKYLMHYCLKMTRYLCQIQNMVYIELYVLCTTLQSILAWKCFH